jgi:hypothetical protein
MQRYRFMPQTQCWVTDARCIPCTLCMAWSQYQRLLYCWKPGWWTPSLGWGVGLGRATKEAAEVLVSVTWVPVSWLCSVFEHWLRSALMIYAIHYTFIRNILKSNKPTRARRTKFWEIESRWWVAIDVAQLRKWNFSLAEVKAKKATWFT